MKNTRAFIMVEFPQNTLDSRKFEQIVRNLKVIIENNTGYKIPVQAEYEEQIVKSEVENYGWNI